MPILYSLVARGTAVLAEYSAAAGNANSVARRILENLPAGELTETRVSYSQDGHLFHVAVADGNTFVCMVGARGGGGTGLGGLVWGEGGWGCRGRVL
jgi:vesicle-associated membrane protein 7